VIGADLNKCRDRSAANMIGASNSDFFERREGLRRGRCDSPHCHS
jgi:hypothetical protein